jgi:hypothetical protein
MVNNSEAEEVGLTAIGKVVQAASPTHGTYADTLARKARVSLSSVYRAQDLRLIGRDYSRTEIGQVYLNLSSDKQIKLITLLRKEAAKHPLDQGFIGNQSFVPALAREYWERYHDFVGMADILSFLYWLYVEKGIASNPDLFLSILHPKGGKESVLLHLDGKGRIAYFIWQG